MPSSSAEIRRRFFEGPAERAFQYLRTLNEDELRWLLRRHDQMEEGVWREEEIERRYELDELLAYFSILEIASIINFVPNTDDVAAEATSILDNPAVTCYYVKHYPLVLPQLYRTRCRGRIEPFVKPSVEVLQEINETGGSSFAFMKFLDRFATFDDTDLEWFLSALDFFLLDDRRDAGYDKSELASFSVEAQNIRSTSRTTKSRTNRDAQYALRDLMDIVADPAEFMTRIAKPPRERSEVDAALQGVGKFLEFCSQFDSFLCEVSDTPLLQSALWHYHSYWFDGLNHEVSAFTTRVVSAFGKWKQSASERNVSLRNAGDYVTRTTASVEKLLGVSYRRALDARAKPMLRGQFRDVRCPQAREPRARTRGTDRIVGAGPSARLKVRSKKRARKSPRDMT